MNDLRYLILFFLLYTVNSSAQKVLSSKVMDSIQKPIPFVTVLLKPHDKQSISAYSLSNQNGEFEISLNQHGTYLLELKAMGYASKSFKLIYEKELDSVQIPSQITLKQSHFKLKEVSVSAKRPIVIKKDTTSFLVSAFNSGTEEVVEDVLKNIPGVQVDDNGSISVGGKSISKVLVDGDDLFERGYQVLTKNMDASYIDRVEIIEHFNDNHILKKVSNSEDLAINLKMNKKEAFFGDLTLGVGTKNTKDLKLNLMNFSKRRKSFLFSNLNTIGADPTGAVYSIIYPRKISGSSFIGDAFTTELPLKVKTTTKKNQFDDYNAQLIATNSIFKLSDRLNFKLLSLYTEKTLNQRIDNIISYRSDPPFELLEEQLSNTFEKQFITKWDLTYTAPKNKLEYTAKLGTSTATDQLDLLINSIEFQGDQKLHKNKLDQRITHTIDLNKQKAVRTTTRYVDDKAPYESIYTSVFDTDELLNQNINSTARFFGVSSEYYAKSARSFSKLKLAFTRDQKFFENQLTAISVLSNANDLLNRSNQQLFVSYYKSFEFNNLKLISSLRAESFDLTIDKKGESIQKASTLLLPKLGLKWTVNPKSTLMLYYTNNNSESPTHLARSSSLQTNNRNFTSGLNNYFRLNKRQWLLSYKQGDFKDNITFQSSLSYQKTDQYVGYHYNYNSLYNELKPLLLDDMQLYLFENNLNIYLPKVSSNIKISHTYIGADFKNSINDQELLNNVNKIHRISINYNSFFETAINVNLGSDINSSQYHNKLFDNRLLTISNYVDLDFNLNDRIIFQWTNENQLIAQQAKNNRKVISSIKGSYQFKNKDKKLSFSIHNIFNIKQIDRTINDEISTQTTSYFQFPRYVLVSYKIKI